MRDMENGIEPVGLTRIWSPLGFVFKRSTTNGQLFPTRAYMRGGNIHIIFLSVENSSWNKSFWSGVNQQSENKMNWKEKWAGICCSYFSIVVQIFRQKARTIQWTVRLSTISCMTKNKSCVSLDWNGMLPQLYKCNAWEANKKPSCRQCHNPPLFSHEINPTHLITKLDSDGGTPFFFSSILFNAAPLPK